MEKLFHAFLIAMLVHIVQPLGHAQTPTILDYTAYPPFVGQAVPPLVMITMSKDHRLFIKGYNDIMDLNGDGTIETTYTDTIDYYGYFDPKKCYTYNSSASPSGRFEPSVAATGTNSHYCTTKWSGNFLNWATMSRTAISPTRRAPKISSVFNRRTIAGH